MNKFKGFYIRLTSNHGCWTDLPIRVEFDEDSRYYNMIYEGGSFIINRNKLNKEYKLCPKKRIERQVDYLKSKLKIYENL